MNNESKITTVIDLTTLFDFGSIVHALTKQIEEQGQLTGKFESISLSTLKFKSFPSFMAQYYKGDQKERDDLIARMQSSTLFPSVKPKLSILSQLYFTISAGIVSPDDIFVYYEDPSLMTYFNKDYLEQFKALTKISNFVSLNDLLKTFELNQTKEDTLNKKILSFENNKNIIEPLSSCFKVIVYEFFDPKRKSSSSSDNTGENNGNNNLDQSNDANKVITKPIQPYPSFDSLLEEIFPEYQSQYKDYVSQEFIAKYQSNFLTKQFSFLPLWSNYSLWEKTVNLEGKIVNGVKRGSKLLGIPTANIEMNESNCSKVMSLINGVYLGMITFTSNQKSNEKIEEKITYKGMLSIGYNPFFDNAHKTIEVFLIDYEGDDFYEDYVSLNIHGYSRTETVFSGFSELVTTITYDIILGNKLLDKIGKE